MGPNDPKLAPQFEDHKLSRNFKRKTETENKSDKYDLKNSLGQISRQNSSERTLIKGLKLTTIF